ncbi:MAG: hypothetical protein OXE86_11620, partial [Alphaproteobacteria bacterium]|nr:hypothetical protein [Alphaproteobacteria bacterium]
GWSPDLFRRLAKRGIACLTWHKNFSGEDWPVEDFSPITVPIHGPAANTNATVRLAGKPVALPNGFRVRQIRRLLDNGRQVPFITTDPHKEMAEAVVVNPLRRACNKAIRRLDHQLARLRKRVGDAARKKHPTAELKSEVRDLEGAREIVKASRRGVPGHCRAGDLDEAEKLDVLPSRQRLLLDVIRMIAYRAETRMMLPVMQAQGKKTHPRKLLRALLAADADIMPDPAGGVLRVRIPGLGNDACDRQIEALLTELNTAGTVFPETEMRMVYDLDAAQESTQPVSPKISRGQEV